MTSAVENLANSIESSVINSSEESIVDSIVGIALTIISENNCTSISCTRVIISL